MLLCVVFNLHVLETTILECLRDLRVGTCLDPSVCVLSECGTVVYHMLAWLGWRRSPLILAKSLSLLHSYTL